ncbi:12089_t:CDS:1, partial [Funneliformis mosseae]
PDIRTSPVTIYQATCKSKHSEICSNSSVAITSLYQDLFHTKMKFSELLVMGFDQQVIVEELLKIFNFNLLRFL